MPIDTNSLLGGGGSSLVDPRDIFSALPSRPWPYLRLEQGEVLQKWFERRNQRDIVIKQNTGGGKTVVGLLIAQSSLNEGIGPAAYFASDTYLVEQVIQEANRLGLRTTLDPRDPAFVSHEAILVATLQRLVNGRSVFGVDGVSTATPLGTLVVDDAHAALSTVEQQFRISVGSEDPIYTQLLAIFRDTLAQQSETMLAEIEQRVPSALLRVPYWTWVERQPSVAQKLVEAAAARAGSGDDLVFQWPLVKDQLHLCTAIFTGTRLEIRPPAPPIHKIPSFAAANRRVYLTATLADDAVLVTDFDADPSLIAQAVTPGRASDIGDRLIVAPLELNPEYDVNIVREMARDYAHGFIDQHGAATQTPINVVVLVPSDWAANEWRPFADEVWTVNELAAGVARLKAGHVGLVVLANKYDGIDLANDACRLLIVDGLPRSLDPVERREAGALVRSPKVAARQVQRVEQGMGRGVRDSADFCAVVLVGTDLTQAVHNPKQRELFSPATRVQLDLSRRLAEQLRGQGMDGIREAIDLCLSRDRGWVEASRSQLANTNYDAAARIRPSEVAARKAFDRAISNDYVGADSALQEIVNSTTNPAEKGWLMEQKAAYLHFTNQAQAQQLQLSASIQNHHVLRPLVGVSVERVRAAAVQSEAVSAYASVNFSDGLDGLLKVKTLLERIRWDNDSDTAESAWQELGLLLGFGSERPEKRYDKGPDNLWSVGAAQNIVFELKTGSADHPIAKRYVDQLGGHLRWHDDEFAQYGQTALGILIAPTAQYDSTATPPSGARVIDRPSLERLKGAVNSVAAALRPSASWSDPQEISRQLVSYNLTAANIANAYSVPIGPPVQM